MVEAGIEKRFEDILPTSSEQNGMLAIVGQFKSRCLSANTLDLDSQMV